MTRRLLITGLNGSLAPALARAAHAAGWALVGWDREHIRPEDATAGAAYLAQVQPDAIAHLAMGAEAWAAQLAGHAGTQGLPFLFTSTAMVFHHEPDGPHGVAAPRTAQDEYGRYKIRCEDAVRAANPDALVVRIGWQIDPAQAGNNMLMALDGWQAREGQVAASTEWRPACSFMADTAAALLGLLEQPKPGVHHVDSNADEGHHFAAIAAALRHQFGRTNWQIRQHQDYRHDQRLEGGGLCVPPLSARLGLLRQVH